MAVTDDADARNPVGADPGAAPRKNIVVCLDGTGNQIGACTPTNVAKIYQMLDLANPLAQIAYYDPGVGTLPASTARGQLGRLGSTVAQLAFGAGMRTNLTQAYTWLMQHYQPGDRIHVFGFSRGAYTARALVGMLTRPGLLRPGSENLVDYAVREYANNRTIDEPVQAGIRNFADAFCWGTEENPRFPLWRPVMGTEPAFHEDWHCIPVDYLGIWDTVKASGFLHLGDLDWPYTRKLPNVAKIRHAVSIDERRRPFREYLVSERPELEEVWFAGVHSDVGGTFDDRLLDGRNAPVLSTIALKWVVDGTAGRLVLRENAYRNFCTVTEDDARARIHGMGLLWNLALIRRRPRPVNAVLHASIRERGPGYPRRPRPDQTWADPDWLSLRDDLATTAPEPIELDRLPGGQRRPANQV